HSVETSGSLVVVIIEVSDVFSNRHGRTCVRAEALAKAGSGHPSFLKGWTRGSSPRVTSLLLLRLPRLHGTAGIAPGGKTAAHMGDRLQAHVLGGLGRERRAHAAGAVEDEFLVLLEHRLGIGARRIDPEFQHAAGAGEGAGNLAVALDLAGIA